MSQTSIKVKEDIIKLSHNLFDLALSKNIKIVTAESCTGGLLSSFITSISGSSSLFDCGFTVYSNFSKYKVLDIDTNIIDKYGAVSQEVADLMAKNSLTKSNANLSVAITGIAGPKSDNSQKEIGLVYISSLYKENLKLVSHKFHFDGDRDDIRHLSVQKALEILILQIKNDLS